MPLPIITDVYRVAFRWSAGVPGARNAVNVMHFEAPGKTAADVWTALDAHWTRTMINASATGTAIRDVAITPLDGHSATQNHNTAGIVKWEGQGGSDPIPQVSYLIKLTTADRGRSKRGRIYLPFPSEGVCDSGELDATQLPILAGAWGTFANDMATAGVALGVASYKLGSWSQALIVTVENFLGTQRRRQMR